MSFNLDYIFDQQTLLFLCVFLFSLGSSRFSETRKETKKESENLVWWYTHTRYILGIQPHEFSRNKSILSSLHFFLSRFDCLRVSKRVPTKEAPKDLVRLFPPAKHVGVPMAAMYGRISVNYKAENSLNPKNKKNKKVCFVTQSTKFRVLWLCSALWRCRLLFFNLLRGRDGLTEGRIY